MRYPHISKIKNRVIRLLWILSILLLGFALSGLLYPAGAEVLLCGEDISREDGIYKLRGHLTCLPTDPDTDPILDIKGDDVADSKFDLRGLIATGDGDNTGIRIRDGADNVTIVGGTFKKCETALRVQTNGCEIEKFKAINSSGKAIRIQGDGNSIVKSLCLKAGDDCFELRKPETEDVPEDGLEGNTAEWCTAIKSASAGEGGQGIQFRGPGYAYKCSVFGGGGEGFQIQEDVSDVTIERCVAINNAKGGIEIKADATANTLSHNLVIKNDGVGIKVEEGAGGAEDAEKNEIVYNFVLGNETLDLNDENGNCDSNWWYKNFAKKGKPDCTLD
jgi:parallel beta-helix repeat protein